MPVRSVVLATNECYHVFNRSIAAEEIFTSKRLLTKALEIVDYYRFSQRIRLSQFQTLTQNLKNNYLESYKEQAPLVEIYSFSFMPNHYHFQLKQLQEQGIARFISNFQNSFAKFFNLKNHRYGGLFQNAFKAKWIETDDQFLHLSRYINLNPTTSYLVEFAKLADYPWSSYGWYLNENENKFLNTKVILEMMGSKEKYIKFVADQVDYQRELHKIKSLIFE